MNNENLIIEYLEKNVKSTYGDKIFTMLCQVEHQSNGLINIYIIKARIRFIDHFKVELDFNEVDSLLNPENEETLSFDEILELCNDNAQM